MSMGDGPPTTPAEAGAQLQRSRLAGTTLPYAGFPDWAPAFAGVEA